MNFCGTAIDRFFHVHRQGSCIRAILPETHARQYHRSSSHLNREFGGNTFILQTTGASELAGYSNFDAVCFSLFGEFLVYIPFQDGFKQSNLATAQRISFQQTRKSNKWLWRGISRCVRTIESLKQVSEKPKNP